MEDHIIPNKSSCCKKDGKSCKPSQEAVAEAVEQTVSVGSQNELEECKAKLARAQADFENFTRRNEKERGQWMRTAQAGVLKDLLAIVDDFDRALEQSTKNITTAADVKSWISGFDLIAKALRKMLNAHGVTEIEQVKTFDPLLHEALVQVDSPEHTSGAVVHVLQKGYMFKGEVLRPAQVSVAK